MLIGLDPFLHDWDERFHALVAKNLQANFLLPQLRARPVLPYDYRLWTSNHVWLHKQPLFLWQMALSMQLFGTNEMALRLPSALLGSLLLWPEYRLGRLIFSAVIGYRAALLLAFAYYQLELTTGWQSVDHNDAAFLAYVTASMWAYYESRTSTRPWRWCMLAGLFAGAAVLCKWLPGLVVYAAWFIELLLDKKRRSTVQEWARLSGACALTAVVALPWQVYSHSQFPLESAFEARYAARHFGEALEGQGGPWYFYLTHNMWYQYQWLVVFVGIGLALVFTAAGRGRALRPLLVSCGLIFGFYSLAATKMPSYTYVAAPVVLLLAALAWVKIGARISPATNRWPGLTEGLLLLLILALDLRPLSLLKHHTLRFAAASTEQERQVKMQRSGVYRHLDAVVPPGYVVFNAPPLAEVEAMFYSHQNVYTGWLLRLNTSSCAAEACAWRLLQVSNPRRFIYRPLRSCLSLWRILLPRGLKLRAFFPLGKGGFAGQFLTHAEH
ncbi:ArnT family glycosyltransferase [Hymenobacter glaciei]|uniref:ArnT family glycosyltransferase n=1 Tax=Hymenobacter glaciei TaxID=877209 RepID=UPI0031E6F8DD